MKNIRFIILAVVMCLMSFNALPYKLQEVPCELPLGWACGATKGTIDQGWYQWYPMFGYVWHSNLVPCCVSSVPSNACQPFNVGCTTVLPS